MLPTFFNAKTRILFSLLLFSLLSAPLWLEFVTSPKRNYLSIPTRFGNFDWHAKVLFDDVTPIDEVFLGGSGMWAGVNSLAFEARLETKYCSTVNVVNLGHNWHGDSLDYVILADLLDSREVKRVTLDSPVNLTGELHPATKYIWRFWEHRNLWNELNFTSKISLYAEKILIAPRLLYGSFVRPLPSKQRNKFIFFKGYYQNTSGYLDPETGKKAEYNPNLSLEHNVDDFSFAIESDENKFVSRLENLTIPASGVASRNAMARMLNDNDIQWNVLHLPRAARGRSIAEISKNDFKDKQIIAPALDLLFKPLSASEYQNYFYNSSHLNENGSIYFSNFLADLYVSKFGGGNEKSSCQERKSE